MKKRKYCSSPVSILVPAKTSSYIAALATSGKVYVLDLVPTGTISTHFQAAFMPPSLSTSSGRAVPYRPKKRHHGRVHNRAVESRTSSTPCGSDWREARALLSRAPSPPFGVTEPCPQWRPQTTNTRPQLSCQSRQLARPCDRVTCVAVCAAVKITT